MSKVVLITGASSGIGKSCATFLAERGFIVYGTSRKATTSENSNLHFLQMDVTKRDSVEAGIKQIISEQGTLDVVVNNAGIGIGGALELITDEEIALQMETNFMGTVNVCRAVLPFFRQHKQGKIINVSSIAGVMGIPYQGFYSASKFAVEGYSEALNIELHRFNIKVVLVEPGDFNTGFTSNRIVSTATESHPDYQKSFKETLAIIEKDETGGCAPILIARKLEKIINKKNPKFRYVIGNTDQVFSAFIKGIVSDRIHQWLIRGYYHI